MSEEQHKQVFRRLIEEGFSKGNLEVLNDVFAPNFVEHQDGFVPPNAEGVKGAFENGQVVEHWGVADRLGMMAQLGLLPRSQ